MSLIGQLPLAAITLSCRDINQSRKFYRDIMGLRIISEDNGENGGGKMHFDLGNIRLTLSERESSSLSSPSKSGGAAEAESSASSGKLGSSDQLVFLVESSLETVCSDLTKRGLKFRSKKIVDDSAGKAAWFNDPDGRVIYLWQPSGRDSKSYKEIESLVKHYESVSRALADLREGEITA